MPNLCEKMLCCGCAACESVCSRGAITMEPDGEGFLYPRIDELKCVNCERCLRVCPTLNQSGMRAPLAVYAAKAKDTELRLESSSGGIFSLLARQILAKGGKVFGAAFDKRDWSVEHKGIADEAGLAELRGSKYVQSRTAGIYREVRDALNANLPVLFTGTPCQIAALRAYLNLQPSTSITNLYLVDVVCHGVPSPKVWQKYLDWQCEVALAQGRGSAPAEGRNIRRISFRHKNCGWKRYSLSLRFANDKEYRKCVREDAFIRGFLFELYSRPSCHACATRELRSGSDITLADFWGITRFYPDMDDDKGTSLVLINTEKGRDAINDLLDEVDCRAAEYQEVLKIQTSITKSSIPHPKRDKFFSSLLAGRGVDFGSLVWRFTKPPFSRRFYLVLRSMVKKVLVTLGLKKGA